MIMARKYTQYYNQDGTESYKGFTVNGCGIDTHFKEITKEEYDRLSGMTYEEVNKEITDGLSPEIKWGYGYYGHILTEADGMYFLGMKIGGSCD